MIPNPNSPLFVTAFRAALIDQAIIIALSAAALWLAWAALRRATGRRWLPARHDQDSGGQGYASPGRPPEPTGRRVLRTGFGLLWVVGGLLQAQPAMPVGLPYQVTLPSADGSPGWVRAVVSWAATLWSYHPIESAASVVWIQLGIGLWLLAAPRGRWSTAAGLTSAGWGLAVWACGEAFGGIFAPGLSWLTGAPGAVAFYCVAGGLIAAPERAWRSRRLGQATLAGMGTFLAVMAVLQEASPGSGLTQGASAGQAGAMAGMGSDMPQAQPPGLMSRISSGFAALSAAHGGAVNLFVVAALASLGLALGVGALTGRRRLLRVAVIAAVLLCLADWVLVQDFGVLGGLGTDPDSMIPLALLIIGGYLALRGHGGGTAFVPLAVVGRAAAGARVTSVASLTAAGLILAGAVPAAAVLAGGTADPLLARSLASANAVLDYPAAPFSLTDQAGHPVSLAGLRGKVVLLTFLDPGCTGSCPPLVGELKRAGQILGPAGRQVEFVAIAAGSGRYRVADVAAFTRREFLSQAPNWRFLTGSASQLRQAWTDYAIPVRAPAAGSTAGRSNVALVIDSAGQVRGRFVDDQALWTPEGEASFAALLAQAASGVM